MPPTRIPRQGDWQNIARVTPSSFQCGFCNKHVASEKGWQHNTGGPHFIWVCPFCQGPNFFDEGYQTPGVAFGELVEKLPADVGSLYNEARAACAAAAYTAAVLSVRKLLMHIAVEKNAKPNQPFITYVEFLAAQGYVPPNGQGWVDHIRTKGNEANHEIVIMTATDAKELIKFSEMLLKFIYEFPASFAPRGQ